MFVGLKIYINIYFIYKVEISLNYKGILKTTFNDLNNFFFLIYLKGAPHGVKNFYKIFKFKGWGIKNTKICKLFYKFKIFGWVGQKNLNFKV